MARRHFSQWYITLYYGAISIKKPEFMLVNRACAGGLRWTGVTQNDGECVQNLHLQCKACWNRRGGARQVHVRHEKVTFTPARRRN